MYHVNGMPAGESPCSLTTCTQTDTQSHPLQIMNTVPHSLMTTPGSFGGSVSQTTTHLQYVRPGQCKRSCSRIDIGSVFSFTFKATFFFFLFSQQSQQKAKKGGELCMHAHSHAAFTHIMMHENASHNKAKTKRKLSSAKNWRPF